MRQPRKVYNQRYIKAHPEVHRRAIRENFRRGQFGDGTCHVWTLEEEERIVAHTIPDRQLAQELRTSTHAIQVKRNRIKSRMKEKV